MKNQLNKTSINKHRKLTIMITESQLRMLAKNLLTEQEKNLKRKLIKAS